MVQQLRFWKDLSLSFNLSTKMYLLLAMLSYLLQSSGRSKQYHGWWS